MKRTETIKNTLPPVEKRGKAKNKIKRMNWFDYLNYAFLILFMIVCFYPFWYVIIGSFSEGNVYNEGGVWLLPKNFNFSNYKMIIHDERLYIAYRNTLGRVFIGTASSILFTSCVAYAMSRRELPQRKIYRAINVFTMFFSGGFIPYYLVITSLGFYDTFWVYVIPALYSVSNMIVISSFFCGIPEDLHEAAVIDGANEFIIWWGIYMPLSVPILSTVALWTAVGHWNAYFNTMVFTRDPQLITLQYYLLKVIKESSMPSGDHISQAELDQVNATTVSFAAIVVATLPILFVYPYVAKKFTNDVMVGAVKG